MGGSVVIAEKGTQAQMYKRAIGGRFGKVVAASGHLFEPVSPHMINPDWKLWSTALLAPDGFLYPFVIKKSGASKYKAIKDAVKGADKIYLATDPDREGEGIAQNILEALRKDVGFKGQVLRVLPLSEDTKSVTKAFEDAKPISEYQDLYQAFLARTSGDQIYNLSLTRTASESLQEQGEDGVISIGRVITPTMGIVCLREEEIKNFVPVDYFIPTIEVQGESGSVTLRISAREDDRILDKQVALDMVALAEGSSGLLNVVTASKKQAPPRLFSLSSLQVATSKKWKWSAKKTLDVLQKLYSEYQVTTYPRSSEVSLPEAEIEFAQSMFDTLQTVFGNLPYRDVIIRKTKGYFSDKDLKGASHFAIVPNRNTQDKWADTIKKMNSDEKMLFEVIARRYMAALGPAREYDSTELSYDGAGKTYKTSGSVETYAGWKAALGHNKASSDADEEALPAFVDQEPVAVTSTGVDAKKTKPPSRYTEGSLIAAMIEGWRYVDDPEEIAQLKQSKGIGTEATRGGILENLKARGLVEITKGQVNASKSAMDLYAAFKRFAPEILDVALTAHLEANMDAVQRGEMSAVEAVKKISELTSKAIAGIKQAEKEGVRIVYTGKKSSKGKKGKGGYKGKPSPKQVALAKKIAKERNIKLDEKTLASGEAVSKWLDVQFGKKSKSKSPQKSNANGEASSKQVAFAEKIAARKKMQVPEELFKDGKAMSAWITANK